MTSNKTSWIRPIAGTIAAVFLCCTVFTFMQKVNADVQKTSAEYAADPAAMIEAYRHVEAASVSDAIEQLLHEKRYMSHRMQSVFPTKFAGAALTVKLIKQENHDPAALTGMLQAIDSGGAVAVIDVDELNVKLVAATPPNETAVTPVKFVPVMATDVPPAVVLVAVPSDITVGAPALR